MFFVVYPKRDGETVLSDGVFKEEGKGGGGGDDEGGAVGAVEAEAETADTS